MPRDKEINRNRIIKAAKEEFLEKGFEKASIRSIGSRAGVTSAALYRHCKDKQDLFSVIVEPALSEAYKWVKNHTKTQLAIIQNPECSENIVGENYTELITDVVLPNRDIFKLILCKSDGTKYAYFIHDLVELEEEDLSLAISILKKQGKTNCDISKNELHMLLSGYTTALFEPIIHDYTGSEILHCMEKIEQFYMPGWANILGI